MTMIYTDENPDPGSGDGNNNVAVLDWLFFGLHSV